MGQSRPFFEISDDRLHLGVAAMVRLQLQGRALAVRDQGVVAELGEERQLAAGVGRTRRTIRRRRIPFLPKAE